ncbi:right-handed parallel beta-helix repeat-containing protein [Dyadobacter sp. BHUBP1]|uniref:right-handed parallel beta-helix repeat-containing protein n=1 Tax=Dyadobacter sp. BHUBP1 TaxID=3424178 RepID=UPI003D335894
MQHIYAHSLRLLVLILIVFPGYADKFVRTTAAGNGDGSSWANASADLQMMINAAATGEAVYVAAGTYKPNSYPAGCSGCNTPQDYTFNMRDIKLYGGFPNTGNPGMADRDTSLYKTILSGDLEGNDWWGVSQYPPYSFYLFNYDDNVRHVVTSVKETNALIDGITIQSGNAKAGDSSSPLLEGELLDNNYGGGIFIRNSNLTVTNCSIVRNQAADGAGAFNGNGSLTISGSVLRYNIASGFGGGIYVYSAVRLEINGSLIESNKAYGIPAIYAINSELVIRRSFVVKNEGEYSNLIFCTGPKPAELTNCVFYGNRIGSYGMLTFNSNLKVNNCTIFGNVQLAYTTLASAINVFGEGKLEMRNTIIYGNTAPNGNFTSLSGYNNKSYNSIIQYAEGYYTGTGNLGYINPSFVNEADPDGPDNTYGTADDGLRISNNSVCVDAGISAGAPTDDILGNPVYNLTRDVGAYEQMEGLDVYAGSVECNAMGVDNVIGNEWYHFTNSGKIMAINPNGMNLGNVYVDISDAPDTISYNSATLLGRTFNVRSSRYGTAKLPSSYTIRFYFTDEELAQYNLATAGNFTPADFLLSYREGGSGCSLANYGGTKAGTVSKSATTSGEYGHDNYGFYLEASLDHFTIFAASTEEHALPVELVSFKGAALETYNLLQWETALEHNNAYFEVQRSTDGKTFAPIGEHVPGGGDAYIISSYRFMDNAPAPGVNYYRLKQVDWDGTFALSRMIVVENKRSLATLYPNPAGNAIRVRSAAPFGYRILNAAGTTCLQGDGQDSEPISIETLPAGIYFLAIDGATQKFVKE